MPFFLILSDFYLISMNFIYLKIAKTGVSLPQVMTWQAGPGERLMWCAGPPRGATRHLGHVAEPGWPARDVEGV